MSVFEQIGQGVYVVCVEDDVYLGCFVEDGLFVYLCQVFVDCDLYFFFVVFDGGEVFECVVQFVCGVVVYGVGVDDDDVGFGVICGLDIVGIFQ